MNKLVKLNRVSARLTEDISQPGARAQLKESLRLYFRRVMGTS